MHALERRRRILDLLEKNSFLTVEFVQQKLDVSPATIRRDFSELARQNLVVRGHGGIHRMEDAPVMGVLPYSRRQIEYPEAKQRIAAAAAKLLAPGEVVIVDGGTTTYCLASCLSPHVRVITNSLPLAMALNEPNESRPEVPEVNMTGGYLYPKSAVLLGSQTVMTLKEYNGAWAFLSAMGVTTQGILNSNDLVVDTQREMMARAEKVAILADESKLGRSAMVKVCGLEAIDVLITSKQPDKALAEALKEAGTKVLVV